MKKSIKFYLFTLIAVVLLQSCSNKKEILRLLKSNDKDDIILGTFKAGESGTEEFVPFLLKDADDGRRSTSLRFYGITVYQEKMIALGKIFKKEPPNKIISTPDSAVIIFYTKIANEHF